MNVVTVNPPTFQPVLLDIVKQNLGIYHSLQDDLIMSKIRAAVDYVQSMCSVQLAQATFKATAESWLPFPKLVPFRLLPYPLISIGKVEYRVAAGDNYTELDAASYRVDLFGMVPRVMPINPVTVSGEPDCVCITFTAGWSSADAIPGVLTNAVMMVASYLYDNPNKPPSSIEGLEQYLSEWRVTNV